jgi:hypothetical protein
MKILSVMVTQSLEFVQANIQNTILIHNHLITANSRTYTPQKHTLLIISMLHTDNT